MEQVLAEDNPDLKCLECQRLRGVYVGFDCINACNEQHVYCIECLSKAVALIRLGRLKRVIE